MSCCHEGCRCERCVFYAKAIASILKPRAVAEPKGRNPNENYTMENSPSPSIGRIVVYNQPGSADGKFAPRESAAMVQKVNEDGTVEMIVFRSEKRPFPKHRQNRRLQPARQCRRQVRPKGVSGDGSESK